jgi:hypothetical protein
VSIAFVPSAAFWTGIAGIVVAGVLGPAVGYWASARADRRRFGHERGLKASDDLRERLDDVEAYLELLGEACAQLRGRVGLGMIYPDQFGEPLHARVGDSFVEAGDAYQEARVRIARLGMRPRAPAETVARAKAAADSMFEGIQLVQEAMVAETMAKTAPSPYVNNLVTTTRIALAEIPAKIERGYELTREFEAAARDALERLLGAPEE